MATQTRSKLGALTSFRFFAAVGVVIYHYCRGADSGFAATSRFHLAASYGALGVAFFFILSGYILAYNYAGTRERALQVAPPVFWWKRFARVYPLYLLALLISAPIAVSRGIQMHGAFGAAARLPFTFLANLFLIHAWHMHLNGEWNLPGWSLSAEAFFYLMFPFLVRKLTWIREGNWKSAAAMSAALLIACWLILAGVDQALAMGAHAVYFLLYNPLLNFPLFVIGVTLYLVQQRIVSEKPQVLRLLNATCVAIVFVILLGIALNVGFPAVPRASASLFFCALIWLGGGGAPAWASRLLSWSPLLLLGEASYAVYLLQSPVFTYFTWFWSAARLGNYDPAASSNQVFYVTYLVSLIAVSILAFLFFEQPARTFLQSRRPWSWRPISSKPSMKALEVSMTAVQRD